MDLTSEDFPGGSVVMSLSVNAGDTDFIPGLGRSPGKGNGNPPQYQQRSLTGCIVYGIAKSQTQLSMHACTSGCRSEHKTQVLPLEIGVLWPPWWVNYGN